MAKKPASRHFIRAWRKERGLTLEQLAERIGMTHQNLGKIERGLVPYNQVLLELLAEELRCDPADLIMRDPAQKNSLWTIYEALTPVQRQQLVEIGETLKKTG
jgi:transcriptional regulator with XRE-family HTH domain